MEKEIRNIEIGELKNKGKTKIFFIDIRENLNTRENKIITISIIVLFIIILIRFLIKLLFVS